MARSMLLRMVSLQVSPGTGAIEPLLRQAVARVDPALAVTRVMPMAVQIAGNFTMNRLMARLTSAYGLLALALASLGLYAVTAYSVSRRTREIGIRMALGADRRRIIRDVVGSAMGHTTIGLVVGVPVALLLAGAIGTQLYDIQPRNPVVLAGAAVMLILCAVAAAVGPARRASRVDPTRALRAS
jgi:ABC-type antimicrobial peptide transport system permease subunit